jgi:Cu-Zn family superoxide dismutase
MKRMTRARIGGVVMLAAVGACAPIGGATSGPAGRSVSLIAGDGRTIGSVALAADGGMMVRVAAGGIAPGMHGMHLHQIGLCTGPGFASAGAHLNPGGKQHGRDNPLGAHLGDLPNIDIGVSGGTARIAPVGAELADADGTALVIHAKPDDYKTDPSGASGDRVACAVVGAAR